MGEANVVWAPQPSIVDGVIRDDIPSPQEILVKCPFRLIGFGGARGGGKTDGVLGKYGIKQQQYGKAFNGVFFRREMPGADDLIDRARELYEPIGASFNKVERQFTFRAGGRLRFRPLFNDEDASKYQGQNLSDAAVEEAGNYPDKSPIFKLFGALRSASGVPAQLILTFNPGGSGHYWLRELFFKPAPNGLRTLKLKLPTGREVPYIYIPSRIKDNPILLAKDPHYIDALHMVGSPELVRAWLEGDFEIHEGSYFPEFSSRHIIEPFSLDKIKHWPAYCGFDWGYNSPFCAVWGKVSSGKYDDGTECPYPKGAIIIYREYTGKAIDNLEMAERIAMLSKGENCTMVADTQIFNKMGGMSIADQFWSVFKNFQGQRQWLPADKERVSGWSQIRMRLKQTPALLYFFSNCRYLLDTLPGLSIDLKKPEDLDTTGNDHGADALRYLCMERMIEPGYMEPNRNTAEKGVVKISEYIKEYRERLNHARI